MIHHALHNDRTTGSATTKRVVLCGIFLCLSISRPAFGEEAEGTQAQRILRLAEWDLYPKLQASHVDHLRLEGLLGELHHRLLQKKHDPNADMVDLLQWLVAYDWDRRGDESVLEMLERLCDQFDKDATREANYARRCGPAFRQAGGDEWPFGWRTRRTEWLNLVKLMLLTKDGVTKNDQHRSISKADPQFADLFRIGYLVAIRHSGSKRVDMTFADPLVSDQRPASERLRWLAEIVYTLAKLNVEDDGPDLLAARKKLADQLSTGTLKSTDCNTLRTARVLGLAYCQEPDQLETLLKPLVRFSCPWVFKRFAASAGLPQEKQDSLYLARPVKLRKGRQPLDDVLSHLQNQVGFFLWVDNQVSSIDVDVATDETEGPWRKVAEAVLSRTHYRLRQLGPNMFWIGRPKRLAAAQKLYRSDVAEGFPVSKRTASRLDNATRMEFHAASLGGVAAFLLDQHEVPIEVLDAADKPVTLSFKDHPFRQGLYAITERVPCHWTVADDVIFLGNAEQMDKIRNLEMQRLQRWSWLDSKKTKIANALKEDTLIALIDTPLFDVATHLQDLHKVPIRIGPRAAPIRVTLNIKGIPLERALDILCLRYGLWWSTEGIVIHLFLDNQAPKRPNVVWLPGHAAVASGI